MAGGLVRAVIWPHTLVRERGTWYRVGQRWACPAGKACGPSSTFSWSVASSLVRGGGRAGLLQVARPPCHVVPLRPPCIVGRTREGRVKGQEGLVGNLVIAPQVLERPLHFGELCCLQTVCARVCVYLLSSLSRYIYVAGNVGANEVEGRRGHILQAPFSAPGPGLPSTSWVGV